MPKCPDCRNNDAELLTRLERLKDWVLYKAFSKELSDIRAASFTQGFGDGRADGMRAERAMQARMAAMTAPDPSSVEELASAKVAALLGSIDERDVVTYDQKSNSIFIGGARADDARLAALKSEAEVIAQSDMWRLMSESPRDVAQKAMFSRAETYDDMRNGKSILYTVSFQQKILEIFRKWQPRRPA